MQAINRSEHQSLGHLLAEKLQRHRSRRRPRRTRRTECRPEFTAAKLERAIRKTKYSSLLPPPDSRLARARAAEPSRRRGFATRTSVT